MSEFSYWIGFIISACVFCICMSITPNITGMIFSGMGIGYMGIILGRLIESRH